MEKMSVNTNIINWFELPMVDVERAKNFYESLFDIQLQEKDMNGEKMLFFPYDPAAGKLSGALVRSDHHKVGMQGPIVYLNANPSIQAVFDKAVALGADVLMPVTKVTDEIGFIALFRDCEGNRIGLHAAGA